MNKVEEVSNILLSKRQNKNAIFIIGNGGSSACAEHMSTDLMFGTNAANPSFKTFCLSSNSSSLTATGNDVNFNSIFSRQINNLGEKGDLLIVISASGNSENLISAAQEAKKIGMYTIGLLGFDGGKLIEMLDNFIHVKTSVGEYGVSEDVHLIVNHLLVQNIKRKLLL